MNLGYKKETLFCLHNNILLLSAQRYPDWAKDT